MGRRLMGGALAFVIANWRWLLPTAAVAALGLYAGFQHMEVLSLRASIATEQAAAEKALNDFKAKDYAQAVKLVSDYAAEIAGLQETSNAQQMAIASAARSDTCIHTDAARAFLGGLPASDKARAGKPRSAP